MRLLAIDGNSLLNRAYYGIRLLSTKDGRFTNGITGFMNILINLLDSVKPDAVCAAFDLKAPTFRHELYCDYKAGRHAPPPELIEQFAPLKELLRALGYTVLEQEGYEADDFLGALSSACKEDDFCTIATGDRDSLQLVSKNCTVLLASTKMGQTSTVVYDEEKIMEEYHVTPPQLIDIKALMGDPSDHIPGVKGIGQKGAVELIEKYGSIQYLYDNLDGLDLKETLKDKLRVSREDAFLSYRLGTVLRSVPGVNDIARYAIKPADTIEARRLLVSLEMFRLMQRLSLIGDRVGGAEAVLDAKCFSLSRCDDYGALLERLKDEKGAYLLTKTEDGEIRYAVFCTGGELVLTENGDMLFTAFLSELLSDRSIPKFVADSKPLFAWCGERGALLKNIGLDTSLSGYLLNPNASEYSVRAQAAVYKLPAVNIITDVDELTAFLEKNGELAAAAAVLPAVCAKQLADIRENGQEKLLFDIEIPLAGVLASMEREGFGVNAEKIEEFGEVLSERIAESLERIYEYAGGEFNVNSPKQLGDILFDRLKLPHGKKTKNGYSTNADTLDFLKDKHPIIPEILEYRTLAKLKSTYCDGLLKVVGGDGRIRSTLNQTETRTGRISSTEPNLQNIPVRRELGRELRRFFIAGEGRVLIDADYSQIELRVLAALAGDKTMLAAFENGDDIHTITASQVFGVPENEVTPLLRSRAKAVNFGIVYGIGAFSLSADIGVSVSEADRYIKSYLAHYAGVAAYMERVKKQAKERGYAETLFGRRRYLPELTASNTNIRNFGERVAMNMPIQGTAADIIKIAMVRVHERLCEENFGAKLILQVHDELIVEAPEKEAQRAAALLKKEMENACSLKVHLKADVHIGKSWYEAKG